MGLSGSRPACSAILRQGYGIAINVASRRLDIPNISHVVNYDLPKSYDACIHRIDRTGRAYKKGVVLTFID